MGIYPVVGTKDHARRPDGTETWIETYDEPGIHRERDVLAGAWQEARTDCFCCTCGDRPGSDYACRNHGSHGERPCEDHDMPGSNWDDLDGSDSGRMPESVQVVWAKQRADQSIRN